MARPPLLKLTAAGLYCPPGNFHVDPWAPVAQALITHAHADHAVKGSREYLTAEPGRELLSHRLGSHALIRGIPYNEPLTIREVTVSFHPAGHVLGSAQIRLEHQGEVWVFSGDYHTAFNSTCAPFEPVRCHTFITESTFAHPCFRWPAETSVLDEIHQWWRENQARGVASFMYAYSLGKAQRLIAALNPDIGTIYAPREIEQHNEIYRTNGIPLPAVGDPHRPLSPSEWSRGLFILPPNARWKQPFPFPGNFETAFASGWMLLPDGARSRRVNRGFVVSDHADYQQLLATVHSTHAERVLVMHGYVEDFVADLRSRGIDADPLHLPHCSPPPRPPDPPEFCSEQDSRLTEAADEPHH